MQSKRVVIIGAGYTGLVAAIKLAEKGIKVVVLERGDTLGGLASGFKVEGASLERAYHHLFKTDTNIISFAQELGISNKLRWHNSSMGLYYDGKLYPFKGASDLIKFKPLSFVNRLRAGLVVLYLQKTKNWHKFQKVSAYAWMKKYGGRQVCRVIWEPLLKGKFNTHFDKVSMAWLWARIHIRAQSRELGGEKLGYFDGGFQTFTNALLERTKSLNIEIRTGAEITSIKKISRQKVQIEFSDGSKETYDTCVATVPSHVFAKLIKENRSVKPTYLNKLNSISYLGARLLIFSSSQNLTNYYWHNINDIELPFLVFINQTKLIDKSIYDNKYVYYIATYVAHDSKIFAASDTDLEKLWFPALKKIFPVFDPKRIHEKHHFRFANAQHIVDKGYEHKLPSYKTPLANVYLANFSQIYPEDRGTNYAVREGKNIAKLINP